MHVITTKRPITPHSSNERHLFGNVQLIGRPHSSLSSSFFKNNLSLLPELEQKYEFKNEGNQHKCKMIHNFILKKCHIHLIGFILDKQDSSKLPILKTQTLQIYHKGISRASLLEIRFIFINYIRTFTNSRTDPNSFYV